MSRLRITQVRSPIGRPPKQRATLRALGLKRIRHTVEHPDRPEIRGMINAIPHLLEWEEVEDAAVEDTPKGNSRVPSEDAS